MTQISTVVFDVGRVLFEWDLRHLFAKLIPDSEELDWFLAHVVTPEWHFQHDAGRPLADMTAELTTQYPHYGPLIEAYRTRFNETIPGPVPGSLDIDLFGDIVVSGVEKLAKPDPAIYALALERFGLQPGEAIFVDDNHANVVSARANGFAAHHFTDAGTLRAELVGLGLLQ